MNIKGNARKQELLLKAAKTRDQQSVGGEDEVEEAERTMKADHAAEAATADAFEPHDARDENDADTHPNSFDLMHEDDDDVWFDTTDN